MKLNGLCVLLALCATSAAHAQYGQGYAYPPTYYYPPQQFPAPRYYYNPVPQVSNPYYGRMPMATYYASPQSYAPPVYPPYYPASGPSSNGYDAQPWNQRVVATPASQGPIVVGPSNTPPVQPQPPAQSSPEVELLPAPDIATQRQDRTSLLHSLVDGIGAPEGIRSRKESAWISGNYIASFWRSMRLAGPLVTTGSVLDPIPAGLGSPSTAVLFSDVPIDYGIASGASFTAGVCLDSERRSALEGTFFFVLPTRSTASFSSNSNGDPLTARPIFATDLGREAVLFNSLPGALVGKIDLSFRSNLGGIELNGRYDVSRSDRFRTDVLLGIRYTRLDERMEISENINAINGAVLPFNGQSFTGLTNNDAFGTTNHFIGAQLGARFAYENPWLDLGVFAKLGLGGTIQEVNIEGSTTLTSPSGTALANGGVLALSPNIGHHQRTVFGILPELGFTVGVKLCENVRLEMGYSALLWNRVVRPGLNFDRSVNTALVPGTSTFGAATGPIAPVFRFNDELFWTHAFHVGLEYRY